LVQDRTVSQNKSGTWKFHTCPTPGTDTPFASGIARLSARAARFARKVSFSPTATRVGERLAAGISISP
jgi:hypothetical protein